MKKIITTIIVLLGFYSAYSQSQTDSIIDEIIFDETTEFDFYKSETKFQFLYVGTSYDDKVFYAGRESGIDNLSGYAAYLFYFHQSGFGIGLVGAGYDNISPNYYTTILSAGYSGKAKNNKVFRYRFSYNRYIYTDRDYESSAKNSVATGITIKNKWVGTKLDMNLPFGKDYLSASIAWDASLDIDLIKKRNFRMEFEPEISIYCGNETVFITQNGLIPEQEYEYETNEFGYMNTSFQLPLSITLGNFDVEFGYEYNIPRSLGDEELPNTSRFSVSLGYIIGL